MNDLHDLVAPYLLDALDADERHAFESHLDGCPACRAEVVRLSAGVDTLLDDVAVPAPPGLKGRVMAAVPTTLPERAGFSPRRWVAITAVAASVALAASLYALGLRRELAEMGELNRILASADAARVEMAGIDAYLVVAGNRAVLVAAHLTPPAPGRVYQLWLISEDGPTSAGIFSPDADGEAIVILDGDALPGLVVGLTEEPAGGSPQPTGDVLATAEL